jgi:hypothetical protein
MIVSNFEIFFNAGKYCFWCVAGIRGMCKI